MTTRTAVESRSVGMGQIVLAHAPEQLTTVLGSCVGLALYHPRCKVGILGHIVLPHSGGNDAHPGKFADTAVPYMLWRMAEEGAPAGGLVAHVAGGSRMFGNSGPMRIGESNVKAVLQALAAAGIKVVSSDVRGEKGRRVALDCQTGQFTVESVGQSLWPA